MSSLKYRIIKLDLLTRLFNCYHKNDGIKNWTKKKKKKKVKLNIYWIVKLCHSLLLYIFNLISQENRIIAVTYSHYKYMYQDQYTYRYIKIYMYNIDTSIHIYICIIIVYSIRFIDQCAFKPIPSCSAFPSIASLTPQ